MIVLFNFFQRAIKESQECAYIFQSNYFKFLITYFNQIILNNQSFFFKSNYDGETKFIRCDTRKQMKKKFYNFKSKNVVTNLGLRLINLILYYCICGDLK